MKVEEEEEGRAFISGYRTKLFPVLYVQTNC